MGETGGESVEATEQQATNIVPYAIATALPCERSLHVEALFTFDLVKGGLRN